MLTMLEFIINTLKNDSVIQSFVDSRIYPDGVDIDPETNLYPLITVHCISERTLTNPLNERECLIQVSVWSRLSHLEMEQIAERVLTLLNYDQFHSGYGTTILRWQRQDSGVDMEETDRRIWHKALSFRIWAHS